MLLPDALARFGVGKLGTCADLQLSGLKNTRPCPASLFSFKEIFYYRVKVLKNPVIALDGNLDKLSAKTQIRDLEVGR